jgi:hypothetical protein
MYTHANKTKYINNCKKCTLVNKWIIYLYTWPTLCVFFQIKINATIKQEDVNLYNIY